MIASESLIDFAYGLLAADATLLAAAPGGIHRDRAPGTVSSYPLVTLGLQASTDVNTVEGSRIYEDNLLRVSAHDDRDDYSRVRTVANRIDTLLQRVGGNQAGVTVARLRREQVLPFGTDDIDGHPFVQLIQIYRSEAY